MAAAFKLTVFAAMVTLASCGGSGGGDTAVATTSSDAAAPADSTMAFGLDARPPLAELTLPSQQFSLGAYQVIPAFPKLSFPSALFLAGVPGENRLVVVQQGGQVRAFANDAAASSTSTIMDLSAQLLFAGEQGLLGLAFDPNFVENRYLYVHYSVGSPRRSVISRFTWLAATDAVDYASEKVLLEVEQPFANHNGGMLAFGPDDYLYIGFGDGGSAGDPHNNAQQPGNPLGSILRIDVHPANPGAAYAVPADNPFVDQAGFLPETWAYGLRNPFRFSFDRHTGELWAGDVGQKTLEEIDIVSRGGNYGWRVYEGTRAHDSSLNALPDSAFTPPVFEYGRGEGVSVTGGYVYRGNMLPGLQGRYVYADYGSGNVWALLYDGDSVLSNDIIGAVPATTSFGEDNEGELYIVSRTDGIFTLRENTSAGQNNPGLLSETGIFTDLATLTPATGFIEYAVNHGFWSDGTRKRRWFAVPGPDKIQFAATGAWQFAAGAVIVKHFELDLVEGDSASTRPLETRLLINTEQGWQGFTYRWNDNGTDAKLLTRRESEIITVALASGGTHEQVYEYPSRTDCLRCHTTSAGSVLGLRTRQLNRDFDYAGITDNQLRSLNNINLFSGAIGAHQQYGAFTALTDTQATVESRARSYLAVNCAMCHRPGGTAADDLDLRFDTALEQTDTLGALPLAGNLGAADAKIIAAGDRELSTLWLRMQTLASERMPPLSSHVVDTAGLTILGQWIDAL